MKHRCEKPLSSDQISWFDSYMKDHDLNLTQMAELVGLKRPTFRDIFKRKGNVSKRSLAAIEDFINRPRENSGEGLACQISQVEVTGRERSLLNSDSLLILRMRFEMGLDVLLPVLEVLMEGDVGTRLAFHRFYGKRLGRLYDLARALLNEDVRARVLGERKGDVS